MNVPCYVAVLHLAISRPIHGCTQGEDATNKSRASVRYMASTEGMGVTWVWVLRFERSLD